MRKYLFSMLMWCAGISLFAAPWSSKNDVSTQSDWDETSMKWQPMQGYGFYETSNVQTGVLGAGCLTAVNGQWPTATFTPTCTALHQTIVTDAFASEFSKVNVTAGSTYTFRSSVATDFVTISNEAGTTVYDAGVGPLTWTATTTEVIRYYLHTDAACGAQNTNRTKSIMCGTAPAEADYACDQSYTGVFNLASSVNAAANFALANDFFVPMEAEAFNLKSVKFLLLPQSATSTANDFGTFDIKILSDNASAPGTVLQSFEDLTASSVELHTELFAGFKTFYVTFEIPDGGYVLPVNAAADSRYWISVSGTTTTAVNVFMVGQQRYDSYVSAPNFSSPDLGTTWAPVKGTSTNGTFESNWSFDADCEAIEPPVEGCLEAENGQYPTTSFVPECSGVAEEITAAGWTGEYSVVTVTTGQEYIFTVSDPTYYITIGDEAGETVLGTGTGSLTWTSTVTGNVRFYTHFTSECDWDAETFLSRSVQCGEVVPPTEYCTPVLDCADGDVINNVTFAGINNDTDCSSNGYGDYTTMIANVEAGETYPMSVTVGAGWTYESTMVWIDFNNDFIFDPVTEYFFIGSDPGTTNTADIMIPAGTAEGDYRLRVRVGAVNPELNDLSILACDEETVFGETEDYTIRVGEVAPPTGCLEAENGQYPSSTFVPECDGTPQDVTTAGWTGEYSVITVTNGETYTFSVSDPTYFITISDEAGTTVLASGTGSITWTANMAGNVRFYTHFNSDCEWDAETFLTRTVQCGEIVPPTDYCEPVLDCTDGDVINNVTFAGINNATECSPNGYGDYTAMQAEVVAGETYSMSVTVGAGWTYEATMVWIDFNNDFIFDPVTEYFFIGSDPGTTNTADITIPAGTADGNYRLRVRVGAVNPELNDLSILACDEETVFGETEDYTLVVGEGGGPIEDCEQIFTGEAIGGSGSSSPYMAANDIEVEANRQFTLESISVDVVPLSGEVTTFDVFIYEDNNGPGAQIGAGHFGLTATTVTPNGTLFDVYPIYTVAIDLPTTEVLSGGTAGEKYWIAVVMGPSTTAQQVFWIFSPYDSASGSEPLYQSPDDGGSWAPYADETTGENAEGVMSVFGTCGDLGVSDMSSFDFAYYPNPVKDELNITSQKVVQSVSVYNLAGQQISTQKLNVNNGKVSTSSLTPGVYVFRAVLEGGQVETFKVIKK